MRGDKLGVSFCGFTRFFYLVLVGGLSVLPTRLIAWDSWPSRAVDEPGFLFTPSPEDWRDVNIYHLLTDRFSNGHTGNDNAQGHGVKWDGQKYHGGDWQGIIDRLDYLEALGVKAVWMSPIQLNIDQTSDVLGNNYAPYHGYQPISMVAVNPYFGDLSKLRELVDEAHDRGIYVILDIVINHMGDLMSSGSWDNSIYHVNEYPDPVWHRGYGHAEPFNDIYRFHRNGSIQNFDDANQYIRGELTGGLDDLRTEDASIRTDLATIFKDLISATDCDGYRVDAAKHVEQDFYDVFMPHIYSHASSLGKTNFICFGEVFSGDDDLVGQFTGSTRHNSMLYFPMRAVMDNVFASGYATKDLTTKLGQLSEYDAAARYQLVNFLDNHDIHRVLASDKLNDDWDMLKAALTFMYTSLQIPCLYYGTEQGFNGGDDPYNREDMFDGDFEFGPSDGDNFNTNHTLFTHVRQLNSFREQYPVLTRGTFEALWEEQAGRGIYAFRKSLQADEAVVALNTDYSEKQAWPAAGRAPGTTYINLFDPADTLVVDASTNLPVTLSAKASKIYVPYGVPAEVIYTPTNPSGCIDVEVTLHPNDGVLKGATNIYMFTGHDGWQDIITPNPAMTQLDTNTWQYVLHPEPGTETMDLVFHDGNGNWENNSGSDWSIGIADCTSVPSVAAFDPPAPTGCGTVSVLYTENEGPLAGATQVFVHVGHDGWMDVISPAPAMTRESSNTWSFSYFVPEGTEEINCVFHDGNGTWDNNAGADWAVGVSGCTSYLSLAAFSPVVALDPVGQNAVGDAFDFDQTGGFAKTTDQGGFGSLGRVFMNYDQTNLYIGGIGLDVAGSNHAAAIFLGINTYPDWMADDNLWFVHGDPAGLDNLHNISFSQKVCAAILIGDEWGDGTWRDFQLEGGYPFGQGIYYISEGGPHSAYAAVSNAVLSQFDGTGTDSATSEDDDGNRAADRWEARIPWAALYATNCIAEVTNLHVSGLLLGAATNGNDRYISGNYLAASATSASGLDGDSNFGFSFVNIDPLPVLLPPAADSDGDGLLDDWELQYFGNLDTAHASSDSDGDGLSDLEEQFAGTHPNNATSGLWANTLAEAGGSGMIIQWASVTGKFYKVLMTPDISQQQFVLLQDDIPATPPVNTYTDSVLGSVGTYQVIVTQP